MSALTYSDKVPTVPGWYWERRASGVRLIELTKHNRPRSWRGSKRRLLASLRALNTDREAIAYTVKVPASHWRVEYAGPIQPPEEPETEEQREARERIERAEQLAEDLYGDR